MDELGELTELLEKVGFVLRWLQVERDRPEVLVGSYRWSHHADVVVVADIWHAHAYRVPTWLDTDLLAPRKVLWLYKSSAVWALRAVLALPPPSHPAAPSMPLDPPNGCGMLVCSRLPPGWRP